MYVYCFYHAISTSPKTTAKCLTRAETSDVLIGFDGVICEAPAYPGE